jgi:hypothetical protein
LCLLVRSAPTTFHTVGVDDFSSVSHNQFFFLISYTTARL